MLMGRFIINEFLLQIKLSTPGAVFKLEASHQGKADGISATTSPINPGFQILNILNSKGANINF